MPKDTGTKPGQPIKPGPYHVPGTEQQIIITKPTTAPPTDQPGEIWKPGKK